MRRLLARACRHARARARAPAARVGDQLDAAVQALGSSPLYVAPDAQAHAHGGRAAPSCATRSPSAARRPGLHRRPARQSARDEAGGDAGELVRRHRRGACTSPGPTPSSPAASSARRAPTCRAGRGGADSPPTHSTPTTSDGLAATLVDFVHRVGERAHPAARRRRRRWLDAAAAALAFLGAPRGRRRAVRVLRACAGAGASRRRRSRSFRRIANEDLLALGDDVRAIDIDIEMPSVDPKARDDLGVALDRYDQRRAGDGARAPARRTSRRCRRRWRRAAARWSPRRRGSPARTPPERRPPCFFDPAPRAVDARRPRGLPTATGRRGRCRRARPTPCASSPARSRSDARDRARRPPDALLLRARPGWAPTRAAGSAASAAWAGLSSAGCCSAR